MSDRIAALSLTIQARAGEEDRLFGSVTNIDIEKALTAQGVMIDRRKIMLAEPIKQLGTYTVPVHLSSDVRGNITVNVVRES
jgi:large subunit ribosomal protein L9